MIRHWRIFLSVLKIVLLLLYCAMECNCLCFPVAQYLSLYDKNINLLISEFSYNQRVQKGVLSCISGKVFGSSVLKRSGVYPGWVDVELLNGGWNLYLYCSLSCKRWFCAMLHCALNWNWNKLIELLFNWCISTHRYEFNWHWSLIKKKLVNWNWTESD